MDLGLKGKVALVTGASKGIVKGCVAKLEWRRAELSLFVIYAAKA